MTQVDMVADSAAAIVPAGDLRRVRGLRFTMPGFERAVWQTMCEMGWPGLRLPEVDGGAGFGMAELCALAERLGAGLAPEPLLAAALAARFLPGPARAALLDGTRLILPAWQERPGAIAPGTQTVWSGGLLTGQKVYVSMAAGADGFLVIFEDGAALVDAGADGLTLTTAATQDGGHYGTLTLDRVAAERIAVDPVTVAEALDEAALGTAAMLLGLAERAFEISLDYLRTRKQFGKPIGSFQALQHRAADLKVQLALTRASVGAAAKALDGGADTDRRQAAVSRAKARAAETANRVTREAIQFHGGIGYTDEADIGLFLRRAMVLANQYGTAAVHRARFARLVPDDET